MRTIYLYTSLFPYGVFSEAFISQEIKEVCTCYNVVLIPVNKQDIRREVPGTVSVDSGICQRTFAYKLRAFLRLFSLLVMREYIKSLNSVSKISDFKDSLKYLYAANLVYEDIKKKTALDTNAVFYSYWLSYAPIAFAMFKSTHLNSKCKFISRAHRSDLYSEKVGVYYPLRDFALSNLDKIYLISNDGFYYLAGKFPAYKDKMSISRLGVRDNYEKKTLNNANALIHLVSCSSIIPVKRVQLIFSAIYGYAIAHPDRQFLWTHIGDGVDRNNVEMNIRNVRRVKNLNCEFLGIIGNDDILQLYRDNRFHCLINLSESEGVPVSMMEAISSGIPVLGTDVGGVRDIVNCQTGRLISVDFQQSDFNLALDEIIDNYQDLTISSHEYFLQNYNSSSNYPQFYKELITED